MFLSASLGNTNLSLALLAGDRVLGRALVASGDDPGGAIRSLLAKFPGEVRGAGYASVTPPREERFERAVAEATGRRPLRLGRDVPLPLEVRCRDPGKVGADRLAVALGALALERRDAVVVDAGTAITVDAVTAEGAFLGGAIAPGYRLAARSLREGTALLPLVEPDPVDLPLGRDTEEAIRVALEFGWPALVDRLVETVRANLGPGARVLATGGDAPRLARRSRGGWGLEPDLVHLGLRRACEGGGVVEAGGAG